ncbi:MAG: GlsB/YeaQ/YmgE family stress response membrane protein [Erysipelotrichaceae bacterium]|nr:GlsB/YeaQ/YmgE family stress response membrane protein [Erysipelotrichaceae bacterium]MDP3306474.1 GlsB/YeaQ/YmgE family stress response membrane protein [Erysipelotrichaceae bacterium]
MFLITGFIAGLLAGKILRGRGYGLLGNIIIGLFGAYIGGSLFNLNASGWFGELLVSTVGAVVFLWVLSLFKR